MMHESGEPHPISVFSEGTMEESTHTIAGGARRNEDIALDMMKFIALTTGYGKTAGAGGGAGFGTAGAASKPDEYAQHLLELYGKCLSAVHGKK